MAPPPGHGLSAERSHFCSYSPSMRNLCDLQHVKHARYLSEPPRVNSVSQQVAVKISAKKKPPLVVHFFAIGCPRFSGIFLPRFGSAKHATADIHLSPVPLKPHLSATRLPRLQALLCHPRTCSWRISTFLALFDASVRDETPVVTHMNLRVSKKSTRL